MTDIVSLQAKAKWQRLVERHFPPTAPHMAAQQNPHTGGTSGGSANRGGRGGGNNTRPSRGGGSSGPNRGGGTGGQGFANRTSRVNPRPSNAGPPAKVRKAVKLERIRTRRRIRAIAAQPIRTRTLFFLKVRILTVLCRH